MRFNLEHIWANFRGLMKSRITYILVYTPLLAYSMLSNPNLSPSQEIRCLKIAKPQFDFKIEQPDEGFNSGVMRLIDELEVIPDNFDEGKPGNYNCQN